MKTSKKLLSLFLAIVMIVTSCSVGFTAFAADGNKTDSNNEYWSDGTDASIAFDSLNDLADEYVPMLLGIDAIKNLLESALGITVTEDTTISDVVAGASPLLLGLLGGSGDRDSVLGSNKGVYPNLNFKYLESKGGVSFWALYQLCQDNKNKNDDLGAYAKETLPKLQALLDVYQNAADAVDEKLALGLAALDPFMIAMDPLFEAHPDGDFTIEEIENLEVDGVKIKDYDDPDVNWIADYFNHQFGDLNSDFNCNSVASLLYYVASTAGFDDLSLVMAKGLIQTYFPDEIGKYSDDELYLGFVGDETSPAYSSLVTAVILYSGEYTLDDIKANYITDAQIAKFASDLSTLKANGTSLTGDFLINDYLVNSNPFSSYARDYIADSFNSEFFNAAATGDVEAVKNVASTSVSGTYIDEVNSMVSSRFFAANFTKTYGERVIDLVGAYPEMNSTLNYIVPETSKSSYKYADYAIPSEIAVDATNATLNNLLSQFLESNGDSDDIDIGGIVVDILNTFLETNVTLFDSKNKEGPLYDLWLNLYNKPIETVVSLIPLLVIVIDEVIVPGFLNEKQDDQSDMLDTVKLLQIDPILNLSQEAGSEIGIGTLAFDLNKSIPAILHWLIGDDATTLSLVDKYTGDIYDNDVPRFLNIYIADKAIHGARIGTGSVEVPGLARTLYRSLSDGKTDADALKSAKATALGIDEAVAELATFAMEAIDEYVADHGNDPRYSKEASDEDSRVVQRGLNNVFVALPQIIDNIGKKFVKKYAIKSDWTYTYDGKISSVTKNFLDGSVQQLQNTTLEAFKQTVNGNPDDVLNNFVDILIGNWINALLDILNDLIQDDTNKISSELLLVQNILKALGGFGEKSIITDLVNGLFQLKRADTASFTLKERSTGFVGFSNESGFFLLSNIQFTKNGESRGIIPVILGFVNGSSTTASDSASASAPATLSDSANLKTADNSPLLVKNSTDYKKLLTNENLKASQNLVDAVDALLSSLLSNTSLNGFDWDSTDNLLSSLVTFASAYLGGQNTNDIVKLINDYLYFVSGESIAEPSKTGAIGTAPTADGDVDKNKVYTSANLSNLVIQTYSLVENIVDYLFYNSNNGLLAKMDKNMLVADALYGIISPDAVAVRMENYPETAKILLDKDYLNWNSFKVQVSAANTQSGTWKKDYLKYGFKNGDKEAFYDALGESLSGIAAIIGAALASGTGFYETILYPVLSSISNATGAPAVMTPDAFIAATDSQRLIKGIITPIGNILATLYDAPLSFVLNLIKGVAGVLDDKSVKSIINGVLDPIDRLLGGAANVVSYLSPTLGGIIKDATTGLISINLPEKEIIVTLINGLLGGIDIGGVKLGQVLTLPVINWNKLASAKTSGEVLLLIYAYVVDTVLELPLILDLIESIAPGIVDIINNLSAAQIFNTLREVIAVVQSPTEVYWTFSEYASKLTNKFTYPTGITAQDADKAVDQLDALVKNVFPLLSGLGVADIEGLDSLVNDKLYTNEILTTIAKALYGALNKNETVVTVLDKIGINVTTKGIAAYLTDKSYGKTYSAAASTLKKAGSWDKVNKLNWGFTNGSAKAQTGFVNGLAAILRPLDDILAIFLAEGSLDLSAIDLKEIISELELNGSTQLGETDPSKDAYQYGCTLKYALKKGVLTLKIKSNVKTINGKNNPTNVFKVDLYEIINSLQGDLKDSAVINIGTNGYESAIIPFLEAFMCDNVKTYKQYKADIKKAKDNILLDVLNPVFGFVSDVLDAPFDTVTGVLPNVAYYIDSNGLTQLISNLLAPITSKNGILGVLDKNGLNIDKIVKSIVGKDLGALVTDLIGLKGVKLNLSIHHLEKCNIQDIVIPLVNMILKNTKLGITIPDFKFATIASHGTIKTVKSAAKNADGKFTTKRVIADKGEVLVAVLRYVADVLVKNAKAINKLLGGIDAIKKNKTIKNVLTSVFSTIAVAGKDDIVRAVFYFLTEDATDSFFDYRNFTYKTGYTFSFGDMDEEFCRTLAPMLDGLVSGLLEEKGGLLGLIGDLAYKDSVISSIACGLYGAIEGVKLSDSIGSLTDVLAMTDIDFTTANVASLLTDKDYGRTYESAASVIKSAGSWKNVNKDSLKWGVNDRDTFLNALCAVLRPIYGVLDVLLNDASLGLFNLVSVPGSDGYTSTIVPLLEAFGCYNIKTQYQYREDCFKAYDSVLLDIINPLWDKVEDILNAPIEMLADILPNLSLFFANDGLLQIIDNLLTPISALLNALKPIVNINDLLDALGVDLNALIAKAGLNLNIKLDIYDLKKTLKPLIGAENVVNLINKVLGIIKIKGASLGIVLPEIDWFKLASHGEVILGATSQVATYGSRIYVKSDQDETLIAVLRFLIDTINYQGNYDAIVGLVSGLLGDGVSDSVSDMIGEVLGMLQGDSDEVIAQLVDLLQSIAG